MRSLVGIRRFFEVAKLFQAIIWASFFPRPIDGGRGPVSTVANFTPQTNDFNPLPVALLLPTYCQPKGSTFNSFPFLSLQHYCAFYLPVVIIKAINCH